MKTLTVIAPAYNEAEVIAEFCAAVKREFEVLKEYRCNMLLVVDGGSDGTIDILRNLAKEDSRVKVLKLSRNFGHQMAFLAGIDHADSDIIVMMDCDLQHPPELIRTLLSEYEKGNDVVYTMRRRVPDISMLRRLQSFLFYRFLNMVSEIPIAENSSDFRLISRRVADVIKNSIRERGLFLRGIVNWVGFSQVAVEYTANERFAGSSKFSTWKLIRFGLVGVTSFSRKPLRAATVVGLLFALFGVLFGVVTVIQYYTGQISQPGFATIAVLLSFFGGVQLMFLGIIGEYVGAVFDEVKMRPHYIIEEAINISLGQLAG